MVINRRCTIKQPHMLCGRVDDCPVCLMPMRFACIGLEPCRHRFHKRCMQTYVHTTTGSNDTCPICRRRMTYGTLQSLIRVGSSDEILSLRYSHDLTVSGRVGGHDYFGCAWGSLVSKILEQGRSRALKQLALDEYVKMGGRAESVKDDAELIALVHNTFRPENWKAAYDECANRPPFVLHSHRCDSDDMDETLFISRQKLEAWEKKFLEKNVFLHSS